MPILIDQFIDATQEWSRRTGAPEMNAAFYPMVKTGAAWFFEPIGKVDLSTLPEERRKTLKVGEVHGHHTIEQLKEWLEMLVEQAHFTEDFLVTAIIRDIEQELEALSEDYAKGIGRTRAEKENLERILSNEGDKQDFLRQMNDPSRPRLQGSPQRQAEFTELDLIGMIDFLNKMSVPSLSDQRDRRVMLDVWREVTAPILEEKNLQQARDEELRRFMR